jgi:hypothetical protein
LPEVHRLVLLAGNRQASPIAKPALIISAQFKHQFLVCRNLRCVCKRVRPAFAKWQARESQTRIGLVEFRFPDGTAAP